MIRGLLETVEAARATGWASDFADPLAPLRIEIFLDENKLGETITGDGESAPPSSREGEPGHAFDIRFADPIGELDQQRVRAVITRLLNTGGEFLRAARTLIEASGVFDPQFYADQLRRPLAARDLIGDYLAQGEMEGLRPHALFEPNFARAQLAGAGVSVAVGGVLATYLAEPELDVDPHPLFDTAHFRRAAGRSSPLIAGLEQYVKSGGCRVSGEGPCILFDAGYYLDVYADVRLSGIDPLLHYAIWGAREGRTPHPLFLAGHFRESLDRLGISHPADDALLGFYLRAPEAWSAAPHPLFDPAAYAAERARRGLAPASAGPPLAAMLRSQDDVSPTPFFDPDFYRAQAAQDGVAVDRPSLLHYLTDNRRHGLDPHPLFSVRRFWSKFPQSRQPGGEPLVEFMAAGRPHHFEAASSDLAESALALLRRGGGAAPRGDSLGEEVHPLFDAKLYAAQNAGGVADGELPLAHYARAWSARGIRFPPWGTAFHPRRGVKDDHGPFDVIFVSHELSRTGAPGILLKIIEDLTVRRGVRGLTLAWRGGERLDEFCQWTPVVDMSAVGEAGLYDDAFMDHLVGAFGPSARPKLVLINTACVDHIANRFAAADIPVVTLVHEMASSFPASVFENIYARSKRVIYPAEFVRQEAHKAHSLPAGMDAVAPQGLLEPGFGGLDPARARREVIAELGLPEDAFLVLGAGSADLRKGVDVFIKLAARVERLRARDETGAVAHFVWLGDGDRTPHAPFSFMLQDAQRLGVEGLVHFPGARANPQPYFAACDAFALTSRLDPFPCVVHEAMACAKPVVAFAGAGGAPEALADGAGVVVGYGDDEAMAAEVRRLICDPDARRALGVAGRTRVASRYVFTDYVDRLVGLIAESGGPDLGPALSPVKRAPPATRKRVLFTASRWEENGGARFVGGLIEGLGRRGFDAELVLTAPSALSPASAALPDVPTLILPDRLHGDWSRERHIKRLGDLIGGAGAAVFAPVFDEIGETIASVAPPDVSVLAMCLEKGPALDDRVARVGRYWRRATAVSRSVAESILQSAPHLAGRVAVIPWGLTLPPAPEARQEGPLRVLCRVGGPVGPALARLLQRVAVAAAGHEPIDVELVAAPLRRGSIEAHFAQEIATGLIKVQFPPPDEVGAVMAGGDVFLAVPGCGLDDYAALSAMGAGLAVLAFSDAPAAVYVEDGRNGAVIAAGDASSLRARLSEWAARPGQLRALRLGAWETIRTGGFDLEQTCERYAELIDEMLLERRSDAVLRPRPPSAAIKP